MSAILESFFKKPENMTHIPLWFMRQAGRSIPEYKTALGGKSMLDACFNPDLITEITLQPIGRYGVDAAIFFSDIIVPLKAAGIDVEIQKQKGPVFLNPYRKKEDFIYHETDFLFIKTAALNISHALNESQTLIGFAGAPLTIASYFIEGGPSKDHIATRAFLYNNPKDFLHLCRQISLANIDFLSAQIEGGAKVIQLFDSWAASVPIDIYKKYIAEFIDFIFDKIKNKYPFIKTIYFGLGGIEYAKAAARLADAIGINYNIDIREAVAAFPDKTLQGNLDPAYLFAPQNELFAKIEQILQSFKNAKGYIFNLGHGVNKNTNPDILKSVTDFVHNYIF